MNRQPENVNPKPRFVEKIDKEKTDLLRAQYTLELTKIVTSKERSAESAAAILAALIFCAYQLAKHMWGPAAALRALRTALAHEAGVDMKEAN